MIHTRLIASVLFFCAFAFAGRAAALVNPSLQPINLFEQHGHVLALKVESIDVDARTVRMAVTQAIKGGIGGDVEVKLASDAALAASDALLWDGATVVAFVGGKGRGRQADLLLYAGAGRWQSGRLEKPDEPTRWLWEKDLEQGMFGTFNGRAERLAEMMTDAAEGRYYFPAAPVAQFGAAIAIDRLPQGVRGVALHDLDGDDRLDIVACSPAGNRVYLQTGPLVFTDRTEAMGLAKAASASVGVADADADGRVDLLLGGVIYLASEKGGAITYAASTLLPGSAAEDLKTASFAEIDRDGYPDVVVSRRGKGLAVYRNPGAAGGAFTDVTAAMGLDQPAAGADGDGFFAVGDFRQTGSTDLFYAVGNGILLLHDGGQFKPFRHDLEYELALEGDARGLGGSAAFAPLLYPGGVDLIFSTEVGVHLLTGDGEKLRDYTEYGNELMETSQRQLALVAEDLDADGTVDVFVASRDNLPFKFFANRGYGSFTVPIKYKSGIFPDALRERGFWGLAVGDADNDGANDLLLGGIDGSVTLLMSNALAGRADKQHPNIQEKQLQQTRIVSVKVEGPVGVVGARVRLSDAKGRVVGQRTIGTNLATGCQGPSTVNLAVRDPGPLQLEVWFGDGQKRTWAVDAPVGQRTVIIASRATPSR